MSRELSSTSTITNVIMFSLSTIVLLPSVTNAQCYGVTVSNAAAHLAINGYYTVAGSSGNLRCNGYHAWERDGSTNNGQPVKHMFWVSALSGSSSGVDLNATYSYLNSWVIGPTLCKLEPYVFSKNTWINGSFPVYPYKMSNSWQEFNPNTTTYETNYNLTVTCTHSFSVGDLLVCVLGGVAFFVLVIAAITTAFSKYKKIKRRTRPAVDDDVPVQVRATPRRCAHPVRDTYHLPDYTHAAVHNRSTDNNVPPTVGEASYPPAYTPAAAAHNRSADNNDPPTVGDPPKYDESPPPPYENCAFSE